MTTTAEKATSTVEEAQPAALPSVYATANRGAAILAEIERHPQFERLRKATLMYPDCWATFTGYPIIAEWDLDQDGPRLFLEALRAMSLQAAVYEMTRDERAAQLDVAAPVDEMIHAVIAQHTLLRQIEDDTSIRFVHMTDRERFAYDLNGYTDAAYRHAWGEPPAGTGSARRAPRNA